MQFILKIGKKAAEKRVFMMFPNRRMELTTLDEYMEKFDL